MIRVSDYVANFVYNLGAHDVFLLSGGGMMHLMDGIVSHPKLKYYCFHHEQSVAMATEAYARAKEGYGVAYFTTGPGATNALTGLIGAWQDSVPCIFISGQSKRSQTIYNSGIKSLRQFGVQEVNIIPIVESVTKYSIFVNDPKKIRYYLEKAAFLAKFGRPGPVWLDIPLDVQGASIDPKKLVAFDPSEFKREAKEQQPNKKIVSQICSMLLKAKRPVIIAGQGIRISKAEKDLKRFIEEYKIPLVTTRLGIDILESSHPLYIGHPGSTGDRAANFTVQNSDLIISIGSRLSVSSVGHEYDKFAREAKIVVVDIDEDEHKKKTIAIDLFLKSDARNFLLSLREALHKNKLLSMQFKSWAEKCLFWKKEYPVVLEKYSLQKERINYYYFIDVLSKCASNNSIILSDAGSAFYITSQAIQVKKGMRYITSGAIATMGYTLPAAIGACIASPKKQIIGVTGDGSFQMNIQELQIVVQNKLPLKLFVVNNDGYLSIRNTQSTFFNDRFIGEGPKSGITCPDTLKIAKAYGIKAMRVSKTSELERTIKSALSSDGPVICEVMTPPNQVIAPKVSTIKMPDGTLKSKPLEDMSPLLPREEFCGNMIVSPVD